MRSAIESVAGSNPIAGNCCFVGSLVFLAGSANLSLCGRIGEFEFLTGGFKLSTGGFEFDGWFRVFMAGSASLNFFGRIGEFEF